MKVFKFGGASINSAQRFINTARIIQNHNKEKLLIVISAMGKTTNALEAVVKSYFEGRKDEAIQLFTQLRQQHLDLSKYLHVTRWQQSENQLKEFFTEVEWLLHDKPVRNFDYYYDQIVCSGELMSSSLLFHLLADKGMKAAWVDVRDVIRTDDNFRDAGIDWAITSAKARETILPLLEENDIVITQDLRAGSARAHLMVCLIAQCV